MSATGADLAQLAQTAGATVAAVGSLAGAAWWLLWPRIEDRLQQVAGGVADVKHQLQPNVDGNTAAHAAAAARAAAQLPELRRVVEHLVEKQAEADELRIPERLQLVELQAENTERRIGSVEQALISQLGSELAAFRRERNAR